MIWPLPAALTTTLLLLALAQALSLPPLHTHHPLFPLRHHRHPPHLRRQHHNRYRTQPSQQHDAIAAGAFKRVCYFRMDPKTEIRLSQVDGNLCTHIVLAFARLDPDGNLILGRPEDLPYLLEVPKLKRNYPHLRVMISVYNELEFNGFPKAAASAENRARFARSSIEFLQKYQLDGVDLDWEFPNFPTTFVGREHERLGLTKILKTLRSAFVENFYDRQVAMQHQLQTQTYRTPRAAAEVEPYLLTLAVAGQEAVLRASYELRQVANLCDWLNIMSYDYFLFKPYAPFTGPNSPLFPVLDNYVPLIGRLSHSWTLGKLLEDGVPRDKIVMGIPTYARSYRLVFRNTHPAPFTLALGERGGRIDDYLDYREVSELLKLPDTVVDYDQRARVPYLLANRGYTWVSYENPQSVREKVRHVINNNIAGYMTWNLNSDDFLGDSSSPGQLEQPANGWAANNNNNNNVLTTFPLHRAMLDELLAAVKS